MGGAPPHDGHVPIDHSSTWAPPRQPPAPPGSSPLTPEVLTLAALTAVLGGLVLGIGTQVLQGILPGNWNVLANSGVAWALGAAVIGALMPTVRSAVTGGAAALVLASISYYWAVEAFEGIGSDGRGALIWSVAGIAAGSAFGLVGHLVRADRDRRWLALALAAGVVLAEGAYFVRFIPWLRPAGIVEVTIGVGLIVLCLVRERRRLGVAALVASGVALSGMAAAMIDAGFRAPI